MRNILQKYRKQNEIKTWIWYIPLHSVSTVCSIKCKTVECYFSGDNTIFGGSWNGSMAFPLLLRGKDDLRNCTSGVLIDKRGTIVSGFCRHWSALRETRTPTKMRLTTPVQSIMCLASETWQRDKQTWLCVASALQVQGVVVQRVVVILGAVQRVAADDQLQPVAGLRDERHRQAAVKVPSPDVVHLKQRPEVVSQNVWDHGLSSQIF